VEREDAQCTFTAVWPAPGTVIPSGQWSGDEQRFASSRCWKLWSVRKSSSHMMGSWCQNCLS